MAGQNTPLAKFQAGTIQAAIWKNNLIVKGKSVPVLKVTVQRRYKAEDGWKSSNSLNRNEVFLAIHVLRQAVTKMIEMQKDESDGNDNVEEEVVV